MRFQGSMTLGQLIDSSADVESLKGTKSYGKDTIFKKEFGHIYYSDKVAYYNEDYKILEIRLVFGSKSADYSGVHVVRMAFYGVEGTVYDSQQSLYDEFNFNNETRGRRATRIASMTRNDRVTNSAFNGIVIPCASRAYTNEGGGYTPNNNVFYSKTGITLSTKRVISCTCPSYKYTFAQANWLNKVHLGQQPEKYSKRPDKYDKKSMITVRDEGIVTKDGIKRTFREAKNPNMNKWVLNMKKAPGMCKHIMMATMLLMDGTIIEPGEHYIKNYNMETLRRTVRDKLANINKNDPGTNNQERKYVSEVVKSLEKSKKEDIKKKTATSESLTKEVTEVAKKKGHKKDLEPGSFEDYLKRYDVEGTIYQTLARNYLEEEAEASGKNKYKISESKVDKQARDFIRMSFNDSADFNKLLDKYTSGLSSRMAGKYKREVNTFLDNLKNRGFS